MCNKYQEFSQVTSQPEEVKSIVNQINNIDFDFTGKIINENCLKCANSCPDVTYRFIENCPYYAERYSLNVLNKQLSMQNVNLRRLCKDNGLKYHYMKQMLNGKLHMKFKYYVTLKERLEEIEESAEYIERENYGE